MPEGPNDTRVPIGGLKGVRMPLAGALFNVISQSDGNAAGISERK
jgi:hypothetical protein